ncbi:MAG: hypothetical protein HOQ00_04455 [Agromyces sp.]|nr:hypothetical protein [Agromyces sp.]
MAEDERQRVERAGGRARRARLTPAPGTDPTPEAPVPGTGEDVEERSAPGKVAGKADPDDDRITRERPPHW